MAAVEFEHNNHIAIVTLNRPEAMNAMNPEVMVGMFDAFQEIENNNDIRVAILTGTGDKAFCAGADLGQLIPLMTGSRGPENEWDDRFLSEVSQQGS